MTNTAENLQTSTQTSTFVDLASARKNLTELVKAVHSEGQRFTLTKYGKPVAVLGPLTQDQTISPDADGWHAGYTAAKKELQTQSVQRAKANQAARDALLRKK